MRIRFILLMTVLLLAHASPVWAEGKGMSLKLHSRAFANNESIPDIHTCEGKDVSPPLSWTGVPAGTKSFSLIVDDPDAPDPAAPQRTWVHWVLFNIPANVAELPQGASSHPPSTGEGLNDWKATGYRGPCPPIGRHRYFFKLYALDTDFSSLKKPTKDQLEKAMQGHILGEASLIGTYEKGKK